MLQIIWNFLAYVGVRFVRDPIEQKHVVLLNSLTIFLIIFSIFNVLILIISKVPTISILISGIYFILLLVNIYLNSIGKINLSRYYFLLLSHLYLIYITIAQGSQARAHIYFISEIIVIFFIFPHRMRRISIYLVSIVLFTFIFFEIFLDYIPALVSWKEPYPNFNRILNYITFAILVVGFIFYIHSTFRKAELEVQLEHQKSEKLLLNILPRSIIEKLRDKPDTIAESFEECTVLFSDIVGFTELSRKLPPEDLVNLLNELFSIFDDLAEKFNLEKIKTIGDAYMVAGGIPNKEPYHAEKVAEFALEMIKAIQKYKENNGYPIQLRIGIHSGKAIAGVIGKKKFIYDLWGVSVNTASRMESHGIPGHIQVSEPTYEILKSKFIFMERGILEVKGIGSIKSYFLIQKNEI